MKNAKGKGKAHFSKSKLATNHSNNRSEIEIAASEPKENNVEESVIVFEGENKEENTNEEAMNEENPKEEVKNEEKVKVHSKKRINKSRKRSKRKTALTHIDTMVAKDEDEPKSSGKKATKRVESMGMIFMCNSKTKKDCYRYKVLGLPASKRDVVLKIYKGMRLFLFDFDLKVLYGIYKAAGPGGYNLEPKAFNSAFPSQVRFTVVEDCLPLGEEKFKKVIKDNYYSKNKFDCLLNSEQVKNLCKLFRPPSKSSKSKQLGRSVRAEGHTFVDRDRIKKRDRKEERYRALRPEVYEREGFTSPGVHLPLHPPLPPQPFPALPPPAYAYRRTLEADDYRRDPLEHHDRHVLDLELRRRDEIEYRDPYILYREPPSYHDPLYSAGARSEYRTPAGLPPDYRLDHTPAGLPPDYHLPLGASFDYHRPTGGPPEHRSFPPSYHRY